MIITIIIWIMAFLMFIDLIKSIIIGPSYSLWRAILYGEDYKKWYKYKQTYLSPKKRDEFKKINKKIERK